MAGYQPEYLNDDRARSGSPSTPFSPTQPPSFKPNVNRMKTKRWVTAKTYSYDGDDWGDSGEDDIYDAYLETHTPPLPEQPQDHDRQGKQPVTSFPGHQDANVAQTNQQAQPPIPVSQGDQSTKALPFVRPADIYKRLNEERERHRLQAAETPQSSQDAARHLQAVLAQQASSQDQTQNMPIIPSQLTEPSQGNQNESQHYIHDSSPGYFQNTATDNPEPLPQSMPNASAKSEAPTEQSAKLPELRPFSGFGDTFLNPTGDQSIETSSINQVTSAEPSSQAAGLDRTESRGFRSVVHQAFDVPETPATDTSSVARSNSETTSVISPIIRSETQSMITGDRTPTIHEEPVDQPTEPMRPVTPPSEFKPGHRRSLTPPSANNSPARRPMITTGDTIPRPESAFTLVPTPTEPQDGRQFDADGEQKHLESVEDERPTVKTANSDIAPVSQSSETDSPASTHSTSANELNDRLQDEIIRSLTPNPAMQPQDQQSIEGPHGGHVRPQTRPESSLIPGEYHEYWNEQSGLSPSSPPVLQTNAPGYPSSYPGPSENGAPPSQAQAGVEMPRPLEYNPDTASNTPQRPLKKKFSWEMDSEQVDPTPPVEAQPQDQHTPVPTVEEDTLSPTDTIRKIDDAPPNQHFDHPLGSPLEHPSQHLPDSIHAQPTHGPGEDVQSEQDPKSDFLKENSPGSPLVHDTHLSSQPSPVHGPSEATINSPTSDGQKLLGFREIMAIKTPAQKISAFSRTRDQFAAMDSGLQNWLKQTSANHPEHSDLVQQNGTLPPGSNAAQKPMPTRAKFPKLSSGSGSSRVHMRHASGTPLSTMMHTQQVQAKGKDLLHSAGVLGGKAGDAAKGFFAKGRNKFRHSGSADKDHDQPASPGTPSTPTKLAPAVLRTSASTREDETDTLQEDLPRIRSLKLDQSPLDVSFGLDMPARKNSVHSVPDEMRVPVPWADEKARPMSSPTQDRNAGVLEDAHSNQPGSPNGLVTSNTASGEVDNHVPFNEDSLEGAIASPSPAVVRAGPQLSVSSDIDPALSQTSGSHLSEERKDDISESLALRPQNAQQEEAISQVLVTSPAPPSSESPKSLGVDPKLDITVSRASSRCSQSSENLKMLVLTPNGLELVPEPQLSGREATFPTQEGTDAQSTRSFVVSKPPSPSPPEDTISKGIEEQILSRKFSFEEEGGHSAEIERRLVSINGVGPGGAKNKGLHQPSPVKAAFPVSYPGNASTPNGSIGPPGPVRVQHSRYSSVPTTHPAHQMSNDARRMSMPMNGTSPAENNSNYAVPQQPPPAPPSASNSPRSSFQNTRRWNGALHNAGARSISTPLSSSPASPSATPKSRSRFSSLISRFHTSSSHSKAANPSPLQVQHAQQSQPQLQPQQSAQQPMQRPPQQPAQQLAQRPLQQATHQPVQQLVQQSMQQSMRRPPQQPAQQSAQRPVQQAAHQPMQQLAQQPVQQSTHQGVQQQAQRSPQPQQPQHPQRQPQSQPQPQQQQQQTQQQRQQQTQHQQQQQQQQKQPIVQTRPASNHFSRLSSGTFTPGPNHPKPVIKPVGDQPKDASDAKKKKGLSFLRRFSYNGDAENSQKFKSMGIKSAGSSPKSSKTPTQGPAPSISSRVPFIQLDNLQTQMAGAPGAPRFYQSLNPTLAKITENPSSQKPVNPSQRTSLHASTVNGRYHSQQGAKLLHPATDSGTMTAPPSVYNSNNRTDYFTNGIQERSQSFHVQPRRTVSSQVDAIRNPAPRNPPSATNTSRPAINPTPAITLTNQQHPLAFNFPPNTHDRLTNNSSPSKQSDSARTVDASQYPLPESRVLSPVNPAMKDLPPPPPPKIPLDYAYPSAAAPSSIRIFSAPAAQQLGNDTSIPSTTITPPATHSLPPPQPYFASLGLHNEPVELPTHDDSSEEILMSSTAYPGQEWQPDCLGNWD